MKEYQNTDRQLHWLSQGIARMNRTFLPAREDDSHTNLSYDPIGNGISGRWIDSPSGGLLYVLDLNTLILKWLDRSWTVLLEEPVFGTTQEELLERAGDFLADRGLKIRGIREPMQQIRSFICEATSWYLSNPGSTHEE